MANLSYFRKCLRLNNIKVEKFICLSICHKMVAANDMAYPQRILNDMAYEVRAAASFHSKIRYVKNTFNS